MTIGYQGFFAPVPLTDCLLGTITRSAAIASYGAAALKKENCVDQ